MTIHPLAVRKSLRKHKSRTLKSYRRDLTLSDLDARLAGSDDAQYYLLEALQEVSKEYDYILIDCPPNLGRATRMAMVAAEGVVIPIDCQDWRLWAQHLSPG